MLFAGDFMKSIFSLVITLFVSQGSVADLLTCSVPNGEDVFEFSQEDSEYKINFLDTLVLNVSEKGMSIVKFPEGSELTLQDSISDEQLKADSGYSILPQEIEYTQIAKTYDIKSTVVKNKNNLSKTLAARQIDMEDGSSKVVFYLTDLKSDNNRANINVFNCQN